ncbi:hypothetical protein [uncultured Rossellomorea sp.]|uniref:hypothetical protein n=1 Tax=uncultured Rossellomorea sp. TaxID=2837549 RepID=UPI00260B9605|nr:hypothetical protein [uncultured Rossellomorea sp.]
MILVVHILARVLWKVAQQSPKAAQVCSEAAQQNESVYKKRIFYNYICKKDQKNITPNPNLSKPF